ncbi:TonB-dependent receptor [Xanthomonas arboricola]|uniref:TonB-dependent receptor n=1 Tax=Xanthomonas arboricola TaxID=56448 RepID=UPI00142F83BD|nr:TonB-dependent receptor [Xanthomonas arboricola]MBB4730072.1 outer membrane receptor protein involved in Fe transport [Xanthomonas arboricola]NJC03919.1 outer membrane receptor protein involved in Fe transport [Xanthomonas arboricola]
MKNYRTVSTLPARSLLCCALAASLLASTPAMAQSSNATLRGQVAAAQAGTTVTATNVASGAVRRVPTGADGSYALVGLPPGTYKVDAGPGSEQTVTLSVASSVTLNLGGSAAAAPAGDATTLDAVQVTATTLQEVKTSEVGTNVSLKQISTVPQLTRNFLEFADTVPGMQFETNSNGNSQIRGGAQGSSAVNVYIDGVGQKSYLFGGVSGQEQSAGNPFPQLAIGEYKVITSNYKAEFDQVGSAAIVASTKSGGNEFHGEIFGRTSNTDFRARQPDERAGAPNSDGSKRKTHQDEYGFALSGPIVQDKAHFFFSYEGKGFEVSADPVAVPDRFSALSDDLPAGVQSRLGSVTRPFNEDLYFGKVDWDIGENDRLELTGKYRDEESRDSVGGQTTAIASKINLNTEKRFDLRWQHYGERYVNEARVSYEDVLFNPTAYTVGSQSVYTRGIAEDDVLLNDGATSGLAIQRKGQKGPSFQNDLTFNNLEWHGNHVIKMGVKYKEVELTQSENSAANPSFYYAVGDGAGTSAIPYQVRFNLPFAGAAPSVTTTSKQLGLYIQDDWDVNDKLQLNIGVRWDGEKIPSYLDNVTPPEVVAALNGPGTDPAVSATYAEQLAKGGVDINDYISNGRNRKQDNNNFAPRLGFSYDFRGDESLVLFGGAGRSYDRNLFDVMGLEQIKSALAQYTIRFAGPTNCVPAAGTCTAFDPTYVSNPDSLANLVDARVRNGEIDLLNNDLKTPYADQYSLGLRTQLGDWNTSATLSYIHSKDGFIFTLGNRYANGDFFQNGNQAFGQTPRGFGNLIIGNNGVETKTGQLLLSADKPYTQESGWGLTAAYTFSRARGNRGNDDRYGFDAATIADYPFLDLNAVPRHRLVLTGIYDLFWGISGSAKLTLATVPPRNEAISYDQYGGPSSDNIRVVSVDAPGGKFIAGGDIFGTRQLDLSLSKDMHITDAVTVQVRGDLINALNFRNYDQYSIDWGSAGVYDPRVSINQYGAMSTPPRTLFMSARIIW